MDSDYGSSEDILGGSPFTQEPYDGGDDYDFSSTYDGGSLHDFKSSGGFLNPNFLLSVGVIVAVVLLLVTMSLAPAGTTVGLGMLAVGVLVAVEVYAEWYKYKNTYVM